MLTLLVSVASLAAAVTAQTDAEVFEQKVRASVWRRAAVQHAVQAAAPAACALVCDSPPMHSPRCTCRVYWAQIYPALIGQATSPQHFSCVAMLGLEDVRAPRGRRGVRVPSSSAMCHRRRRLSPLCARVAIRMGAFRVRSGVISFACALLAANTCGSDVRDGGVWAVPRARALGAKARGAGPRALHCVAAVAALAAHRGCVHIGYLRRSSDTLFVAVGYVS